MISSFFGKSKPINIVIVSILVALVFSFVNLNPLLADINLYTILRFTAFLVVTVFSIFVIDFIIGKNNLTQKNSYTLLLFGLFVAILPQSINNVDIILANVFVLLAVRRLISLKSNLGVKRKLFDAAFWLALATLSYFWAILFFVLVIIALAYYWQNDFKNILVPIIGVITVAVLFVAFNIVVHDAYVPESYGIASISFDFSPLNALGIVIGGSLLFLVLLWAVLFYLKAIQEKTKKQKAGRVMILVYAILAIIVIIITPDKTGGEFLFLSFPLAVITTSYLEKSQDNWFKEALLILLVCAPILILVLHFLTKS
jgi:hypothetical protein